MSRSDDWRLSWPPLEDDPRVRADIDAEDDGYPPDWPRDELGPIQPWEVDG